MKCGNVCPVKRPPCPSGQTRMPRYQAMGISREACIAGMEAANPYFIYSFSKYGLGGMGAAVGGGFGSGAGGLVGAGVGGYLGKDAGTGIAQQLNDWAAGDWCDEKGCH